MQNLLQDLRYGLRMLLNKPGFSAVAVITLALGIGANTAIYSVMHAAFFASYPIEKPDDLLRIYGGDEARSLAQLNLSIPKFQFVRDQQTSFKALGAANYTAFTLLDQGDPEQINGAFISSNFLQTFGAAPVLGRFFRPEEEETGSVAVISETLWHKRFGADPEIVGRALNLSGVAYTVVGVAPRLPGLWQTEAWVTQPFQLPGVARELLQRGVSFLNVIGRVNPGVTDESAQQELSAIAQRYQAENAEKADSTWNLTTLSMRADVVGTARSPLFMLFFAVGLVLLLACANVANLLFLRFSGRRREIAMRQALGASRWRVIRQFCLESMLVSVVAAALGVLLAVWCQPALVSLAQNFVAFSTDIKINLPVLTVTLGVALLTGLLMGCYPAVQCSRCDLAGVLREGGRSLTTSRGQRRVRNGLVSVQVAVSLVLIVGASLLILSFFQLQQQSPGFRADNVFIANLTTPTTRYPDPEAQSRFYLRLVEEMRAESGVVNAGLIQGLPLTGANSRTPYATADGEVPPLRDRPLGLSRSVTPGYFATMGIPLLAGRDFTEQDRSDAAPVAIISRNSASKLFTNEDPLGRRVFMGSQNGTGLVIEVIGLVEDVRSQTLERAPEVEFYRPVMQRPSTFMQLVVRTQSNPEGFAAGAREALKRVDAQMPINEPTTLSTIVAQSLAQQRLLFTLLGVFAALALALATVGIYSVVAYTVSQRTSEIGIRMALGAQPGNICRLIIGQGMKPVVLGVVAGLIGCLALGSFIQNQLYGISALDPLTLAATSIGLAGIAAAACWLPARKAMRVDPMLALRSE